MKCYVTDGSGLGGVTLEERAGPGEPGEGQVVVDVRAVALNYRDLLVAEGRYGGDGSKQIVACSDMAGVVAAVGEGVDEFKKGDRVLNAPFRFWPAGRLRADWVRTFVGGAGVDGVLAERVSYPAASLVKVPEHLSFEEGSTLPIAGLTAWAAVITHGRATAGDWVLLHGTGGVSIFGAQIAKAVGARVIMTTSSGRKGEMVKRLFGVDHVIDYREDDWPTLARKHTGGQGVDVVVEVAGGASVRRSIQACGYGARVGVIGVLDGSLCRFDVFDLIKHQVTLRGILMESAQELRDLARAVQAAEIRPHIDRVFPFNEAQDAYRYLRSQEHIGKVVIKVAG